MAIIKVDSMGEAMIDDQKLEQIGEYVKAHLGEWVKDSHIIDFPSAQKRDREIDLLERMVRVEESLRNQNILMEKQINQIDKRFEQVDKRFKEMNSRFNHQFTLIALGFAGITALITVFQFMG